jgi:hypothetical protein
VLDLKGARRDPMPPGRWTALFFLDEATAFAAGHRPCAYCRRTAYNAFTDTWRIAHRLARRPKASEIDAVLHEQRVEPLRRRQRTHPARFGRLPDGAMVRFKGEPALVLRDCVLPWSFEGYGRPVALARSARSRFSPRRRPLRRSRAATGRCCTRRRTPRSAEPFRRPRNRAEHHADEASVAPPATAECGYSGLTGR